MTLNNQQFRILHWNSNGISNYSTLKQFEVLLEKHSIHVASLNETFFTSDHRPYFCNYLLYRNDRTDTRGGGVALLVHRSIEHRLLPLTRTTNIENLSIEVTINQRRIVLCTAYCPRYTANFKNDVIALTQCSREFILLGDLNSKHTSWRCESNNRAGTVLNSLQHQCNFFVFHSDSPTLYPHQNNRTPSTVDLVLSNTSLSMHLKTLGYEIPSDHRPVMCTIRCSAFNSVETSGYDYAQCNWRLFKREVRSHIRFSTNSYHTTCAINRELEAFKHLILRARDRAVPRKFHSKVASLPACTMRNIRERNKFKRKANRSSDDRATLVYNQCIRFLTKTINRQINKERNRQWSYLLENMTPGDKKFWKVSRSLRGKRKMQLPPLEVGNDKLVSDEEKAEILANTFLNSHILTQNYKHPSEHNILRTVENFNSNPPDGSNVVLITESELTSILLQIKATKAPGLDNIPNILLKNLPEEAVKLLVRIFNSCMKLNYFPSEFKKAKVVAVHKASKPRNNPSSYRPISLLSNLGKIYEKCILYRMNEFAVANNLIIKEQFGFKRDHSTVHQTKRICNKILLNKSCKKSTGMVLLDIEKAFDTVWHNGLIYKLISMNFPEYLCKIIADYLKNRSFCVSVNNRSSSFKSIPAGLPQGSILSPILYSLYTSDFKHTRSFNVAYYADDTALISSSKLTSALLKKMEKSLESCNKYFTKWKIKINHAKTQAIIFPYNKSPKRNPARPIIFNGNNIEIQKIVKYLGVTFDHKLLFSKHINSACEKAVKSLRALWPILNRRSPLNLKNKNLIYKCVIRPILSYASPVWYKAARCHIKKMQIIQNKCLKMIHNKHWRFPTQSLHDETGYEKYRDFIERQNLNFFTKVRNSFYEIIRECIE